MRTIAIVNQKGGCGKTTTTINLAAFLALERRRTLVVDMDPQGHATLGLLTDAAEPSRTISDVLLHGGNGKSPRIEDVIRPVRAHLDVVPADILLSAVPESLAGLEGRERVLANVLGEISSRYDYVVVDCPPHVGLLTFNALYACSEAIVPVDPSFFSLHGIGKVFETFEVLATKTGHEIAPRALVTLYTGRTRFAREVVDEIRTHLEGRYFETIIRHSVKLAEAASHALPISAYCRRCAGFDDYQALAAEVLAMEPARALVSPPGPSAPRVTPEGVVFALDAPGAGRVQLVGDFNAWSPDGNEMTRTGNVWTSVLSLQPGRYRYRYVIDGRWQSDPLNTEVEPSPFGSNNSVLVLD